MTRKLIIAGNWKMNNTIGQAMDLVHSMKKEDCDTHKVEIIVAPPFTALKAVYDELDDSSIHVSAQDMFWEESGAYTGEISPVMLKETGCKWVIVGHSERRRYFGETDGTVNRKTKAALHDNLKVMVCVGETLEEREAGETFAIIEGQLEGGLADVKSADFAEIVIAYEPVWAIGTGKTATTTQVDEVHARIRKKLGSMYSDKIASSTRIIYGGSVKPENAGELLALENVDGALVGGASLNAHDFCRIIKAAVEIMEG